ncbi:glucose-6-phosphate isomerase [Geovibrio thiophilus]|uniref:Glucose-6-phosphate isomerase n=1 Tax=Geovibrio thiophilus TaxID=139438 RepID=A0A410JXY7_9BACT|nr:glucose-6-phosphate isomerase [Geovibrio thiophilus]QAR33034.1 glucose-6-phosphate isomerase [Geovibrio thiophilus]
MERIRLDYNYVSSAFIKGGMGETDFEQYKEKARLGLSRLIDLVNSGSIGFPNLKGQNTVAMKSFAKEIKGSVNDFIVAGIGGSSLGLETLCDALLPFGYNSLSYGERGSKPRIWVADNVDPSKVASIMNTCEPDDTFICVISKSGSTVETAANFNILYEWLKSNVKDISKKVVVITDPDKGIMRSIATEKKFRAFDVPSNVGGRYSVLSPVGLLPAAVLGMDIDRLIKGGASITSDNYEMILVLASIYMYYMDNGRNMNVMMPYSSRLKSFSAWFCQLWGESLGKRYDRSGKEVFFGSTPVPSVGVIDQHSLVQLFKEGPSDKLVTFIEVLNHESDKTLKSSFPAYDYLNGHTMGELCNVELKATEAALKNTGKPSLKLIIDVLDEYTLGQLFMLYQYVVPVIGLAHDIDPFDQPGVEEGKEYAYGLLGRDGFEEKKKAFTEIYRKQNDFIL